MHCRLCICIGFKLHVDIQVLMYTHKSVCGCNSILDLRNQLTRLGFQAFVKPVLLLFQGGVTGLCVDSYLPRLLLSHYETHCAVSTNSFSQSYESLFCHVISALLRENITVLHCVLRPCCDFESDFTLIMHKKRQR